MLSFFSKMRLATKIVGMVVLAIVIVAVVNLSIFISRYEDDMHAELQKQAESFIAVADAAKDHAAKVQASGALNMEEMLAEVKEARERGRPYSETKIFATIPVVAGWSAAEAAAKQQDIEFHVPAFDARNPLNDPSKDTQAGPFRSKMLRDLVDQVHAGKRESLARVDSEHNNLHVMRPIVLDASCLTCHGDRSQSASGDGKDVLGFVMEGWKAGDMHGAYEVVLPLKEVDAHVASFALRSALICAGLAIACVAIFMFSLRWLFSRPLASVVEKFRLVGEGDLTQRIELKRGDEIGQLAGVFNTVATNLAEVVGEVTQSADNVAAAATELAASSEEMAAGMKNQADQVGRVSSAMVEMNGSVQEISQKAADASSRTGAAGQEAAQGEKIVSQTVQEIDAIARQVDESAIKMGELGRKTEEIGTVIRVITEIAEQTNLLALNAAIEAARAGEHGRGFAVVADEVRKLAERTQNATQEVGASIHDIQTQTRSAVEGMEAGREKVKRGVDLAKEAGSALARIVSGSEGAVGQVNAIAAATTQQGAASEDITRSIEQITAVCSEATRGAAEGASAASDVSRQAERLKELMRRFRVKSK
ncbi:MAG: methyl-accepting chemotaxis protein [Phycisphaerales bacterium]|nr:methyl-accepting chemotaxis protein [Phycisphaerales bacterium]